MPALFPPPRLSVSILAYHSIHPDRLDGLSVPPWSFHMQMKWLASRGYRGVRLSTLAQHLRDEGTWPHRMVAITFDDGYRDNLTHAWPILQEFGFVGTVFVITDRVGTTIVHNPNWLNLYPAVSRHAYSYLSWAEIYELRNNGLEIGSHTCTHPFLDEIDLARQDREVKESKALLGMRLGQSVESFCYPAGRLTEQTVDVVRAAGYQQAVVTPWKAGLVKKDWFTLKRVGVYRNDGPLRFWLKISPFFEIVRTIKHFF